jgi:hypothetical protein
LGGTNVGEPVGLHTKVLEGVEGVIVPNVALPVGLVMFLPVRVVVASQLVTRVVFRGFWEVMIGDVRLSWPVVDTGVRELVDTVGGIRGVEIRLVQLFETSGCRVGIDWLIDGKVPLWDGNGTAELRTGERVSIVVIERFALGRVAVSWGIGIEVSPIEDDEGGVDVVFSSSQLVDVRLGTLVEALKKSAESSLCSDPRFIEPRRCPLLKTKLKSSLKWQDSSGFWFTTC